MNKRNIGKIRKIGLALGGLGIFAFGYSKILKTNDKTSKLKEEINNLRIKQEFSEEVQEVRNRRVRNELEEIRNEIITCYDHIEALSNLKGIKCKYADECEEFDCYYEEFAEKTVKEINEKSQERKEEVAEEKELIDEKNVNEIEEEKEIER